MIRRIVNIILVSVIAVFSLWCTTGLMRENDQAALLAGANDLATGQAGNLSGYYQFDKFYGTYFIGAGIIKIYRMIESAAPFLSVLNISAAVIFWTALFIFVFAAGDKLSGLMLSCFLLSSVVLLNTLYFNTHVLSSAFLFVSVAALISNRKQWLAPAFFFIAVAMRADVILLLPLLLWLKTPVEEIVTALQRIKQSAHEIPSVLRQFSGRIIFAVAGLAAVLLGPVLCGGGRGANADLIFDVRVIAVFFVFGFGAAGVLFIFSGISFLREIIFEKQILKKVWLITGLLSFCLPVLFFLPQLHTPRYFFRGCEVLLFLSIYRPLAGMFYKRTVPVLACLAIIPAFAGIKITAQKIPVVTISHAERFPTADGHCPMGGYFSFMLRLRNAMNEPVDHNQIIWNELRQADFRFSSNGEIPVLWTPMFRYFTLEASLRGGRVVRILSTDPDISEFYTENRSFMRGNALAENTYRAVFSAPSRFVSPGNQGIGILLFGSGDDRWGKQTEFLNRIFNGKEYRIVNSTVETDHRRKNLWFSREQFPFLIKDFVSGLYYTENEIMDLKISRAETVFPGWMPF